MDVEQVECEWSVVQLDYDMYGTLDAELDVQRTIKRAEFTAFLCLFGTIVGTTTAPVDDKGLIDGRRNEVHLPRSEGRQLVGFDLGGGTHNSHQFIISDGS